MKVIVEFYGIPRRRAGVAQVEIEFASETATLNTLISTLVERFPGFAEQCMVDGRLRGDCAINLNGEQFVRDPEMSLHDGQHVLLMSADAGG